MHFIGRRHRGHAKSFWSMPQSWTRVDAEARTDSPTFLNGGDETGYRHEIALHDSSSMLEKIRDPAISDCGDRTASPRASDGGLP